MYVVSGRWAGGENVGKTLDGNIGRENLITGTLRERHSSEKRGACVVGERALSDDKFE